jgi:hypothetical protein
MIRYTTPWDMTRRAAFNPINDRGSRVGDRRSTAAATTMIDGSMDRWIDGSGIGDRAMTMTGDRSLMAFAC